MPKPILLLLFFAITLTCKSQLVEHHHNKIDAISNAKQVNSIIHDLLPDDYEDFIVNRTLSPKYKQNKVFISTHKVAPWAKADFDNNGYTDLLIIANRQHSKEDEYMVICILDSGNNHFFVKFISREKGPSSAFAISKIISNNPAILYYHFQPSFGYNLNYLCDTLVYGFDDFVEYNPSTQKSRRIEKISFELRPTYMFGRAPSHFIDVTDSQTASTYTVANVDSFVKQKESVQTITISTARYNQIIDLINYIDFANLKGSYRVLWTDDNTGYLTITYDNGKTKTIEDYGMQGTFGLRRVYDMLSALRHNQSSH